MAIGPKACGLFIKECDGFILIYYNDQTLQEFRAVIDEQLRTWTLPEVDKEIRRQVIQAIDRAIEEGLPPG